CLGLRQLGLERGDKVAVISGNRPAWLYAELAAQAAGAVPLGIFVDASPEQVQSILDHSEARFVLVEDQEQADKVLGVRDGLPRLARIVVDDGRGLETYDDPILIGLDEVVELGAGLGADEARRYEALLDAGAPDDVALLAYTSGTTGASKAAMLSHRNLLAMAAGGTACGPVPAGGESLPVLPCARGGAEPPGGAV